MLKIKNDQNELQQILAPYIIDSILIIKSLKLLVELISSNTKSNGTIEINISGKATCNTIQIIAESALFDPNELDEIILSTEKTTIKQQSENLTIADVRIIQEVHNGSMGITPIDSDHFEVVLVFPKQV